MTSPSFAVPLPPITDAEPCGPSLEYDAEYAVLLARMAPRAAAQYGSFTDTPEAPNWAEVERDCRRLLLRTYDINILLWLCRARARLAQAAGLAGALSTLCTVLHNWPDAVHPQLVIDGEADPALRANALAAMTDAEGLLDDVREIVVAANTAMRLTVRDVERAFAVPRSEQGPSAEAVAQQLAALRVAAEGSSQSPLHALAQASQRVNELEAWSRTHLADSAPSFQVLRRLLAPFALSEPATVVEASTGIGTVDAQDPDVQDAVAQSHGRSEAVTRHDVLRSIRASRQWFEDHEPSSPVAVLLKQAERMVGRRFCEVADSIPLDLLRKWESVQEVPGGTA